jgi:hypothetical protein
LHHNIVQTRNKRAPFPRSGVIDPADLDFTALEIDRAQVVVDRMLSGRLDAHVEGRVFAQIPGIRLARPLGGFRQSELIGLSILPVENQLPYLGQDACDLRRLQRIAFPRRNQTLVVEDNLLGERVAIDFDVHFAVAADQTIWSSRRRDGAAHPAFWNSLLPHPLAHRHRRNTQVGRRKTGDRDSRGSAVRGWQNLLRLCSMPGSPRVQRYDHPEP